MKKWNKLLALLLALVMALGLAACGNDAGDTSTPPSDEGTNTNAPTSEEPEGTKTFVFGSDANATSFNSATDLQTNSARALVNSVLETLWVVEPDGSVTLDLAESYEWSGSHDTGDLALTVTLPAAPEARQGCTP